MQLPINQMDQRKNRVDFMDKQFKQLVDQKGQEVLWYQTTECPCRQQGSELGLDLASISSTVASTTGFNNACPVCKGQGIILHSPQIIMAIITSMGGVYSVSEYGVYRDEKVNITTHPEHLLAFGDKLVLQHSVMRYTESVTMPSSGLVASTRYPIVKRSMNLASGEVEIGVLHLQKANAQGLAVLGGVLIQDQHFTITTDGKIDFSLSPSLAPQPNTLFSVSYFMHPIYKIGSYPHSIRDTKVIYKQPSELHTPLLTQATASLDFFNV